MGDWGFFSFGFWSRLLWLILLFGKCRVVFGVVKWSLAWTCLWAASTTIVHRSSMKSNRTYIYIYICTYVYMYESRKILNKYHTKVPYHGHIIHTMIVLIILLLDFYLFLSHYSYLVMFLERIVTITKKFVFG